jgi:site-specific DNA-methyltransferase (adenine-specific)
MNRVLLSSKNMNFATPWDVFKSLHRLFKFTFDGCSSPETAKCKRFAAPGSDAINYSWAGETVFQNPIYGRGIRQWVLKARNEALEGPALSVSLLPYRPDPEWFATAVLSEDGAAGRLRDSYYDPVNRVMWLRWQKMITGIHSVPDRIPFEGEKNGAPFPSAIVIHSSLKRKPFKREGLTQMWPR